MSLRSTSPASAIPNFGSSPLSSDALSGFRPRAQLARRMVAEREAYLASTDADSEIFGTHWGREWLDPVAAKIGAADAGMLDRLRLVYNFTGFPIVPYRRPETFPRVDPVFARYLKLREITPPDYRFVAPAICGEAGWEIDGGLVNVDTAIMQERIQFLYFGGVADWLKQRRDTTVLEIGAGCGLFALAVLGTLKPARYMICDVPEVLAVAYGYLNLAVPEIAHHVALPDGVWRANDGARVALEDVRSGVLYIPNYMMHRHGSALHADMVVNAMSLHEMRPAQIDYYCDFIRRSITPGGGVFVDINCHRFASNPMSDPALKRNFRWLHRLGFIELALGARIWTNSLLTLLRMRLRYQLNWRRHDVRSAFRIDAPYEHPEFSAADTARILNEDFGTYVGVDLGAWMAERNYAFANHLAWYRERYPTVPRPRSQAGSAAALPPTS
jgi:hypothetical protein